MRGFEGGKIQIGEEEEKQPEGKKKVGVGKEKKNNRGKKSGKEEHMYVFWKHELHQISFYACWGSIFLFEYELRTLLHVLIESGFDWMNFMFDFALVFFLGSVLGLNMICL